MATINDQASGVTAKVSTQGSLLVTTGDDGYPTYFTKVYHPRLTAAIGANNVLWAFRAPISRTDVIRGGQIKISMDVTLATMAEVGVTLVRFIGADPGGGTITMATNMRTVEGSPNTLMIKSALATAALTMTGATVDAATAGLIQLTVPGVAGSQAIIDLSEWTGFELQPGEGVALLTTTPAPIGFTTSGWLQFSEIPA